MPAETVLFGVDTIRGDGLSYGRRGFCSGVTRGDRGEGAIAVSFWFDSVVLAVFLLSTTMLAISHQCMDASISDAKVPALVVRTGEAIGIYPLWSSPPAFHLTPGTHWLRHCPSTQRGRGAETTGRAIVWGAGFQQTGE